MKTLFELKTHILLVTKATTTPAIHATALLNRYNLSPKICVVNKNANKFAMVVKMPNNA